MERMFRGLDGWIDGELMERMERRGEKRREEERRFGDELVALIRSLRALSSACSEKTYTVFMYGLLTDLLDQLVG